MVAVAVVIVVVVLVVVVVVDGLYILMSLQLIERMFVTNHMFPP